MSHDLGHRRVIANTMGTCERSQFMSGLGVRLAQNLFWGRFPIVLTQFVLATWLLSRLRRTGFLALPLVAFTGMVYAELMIWPPVGLTGSGGDGLRAVAAMAIVVFHCGLWVRLSYPYASGA